VKEIEIPFMFFPQVGALVSILYLGMWLPKKFKGTATIFEVETPTEQHRN
jgi:hypothetical protein